MVFEHMTAQEFSSPVRLKSSMTAALLLAGLMSVLNMWYGIQWRIPAPQIELYFRVGTVAFAFVLLGLIWVIKSYDERAFLDEPPMWLGSCCSALSLVQAVYLYGASIGGLGLPLAIAFLPFFGLLLLGKSRAAVGWLVLSSVATCLAIALWTPIDVNAANMLPIVMAACSDAAAGINPYGKIYTGIAAFPLYYFPGLWAPYCIPLFLGIDVRWLNIVLFSGMLVCSTAFFGRRTLTARWLAFVLPLFVSPVAVQMLIHGHLWPYWAVLLGMFYAVWQRRPDRATLLMAMGVGMRQLAVFLAIPIAATLFGPDLRATLRRALLGIAVLVVLVLPAIALTPDFLDYFFFSIAAETVTQVVKIGNPQDQIALSGLLAPGTATWILQLLQVSIAMCGFVIVLRSYTRGNTAQSLVYAGISYLIAISLNPFLNRYFYFPGLLLVSLGAGLRGSGNAVSGPAQGRIVDAKR